MTFGDILYRILYEDIWVAIVLILMGVCIWWMKQWWDANIQTQAYGGVETASSEEARKMGTIGKSQQTPYVGSLSPSGLLYGY